MSDRLWENIFSAVALRIFYALEEDAIGSFHEDEELRSKYQVARRAREMRLTRDVCLAILVSVGRSSLPKDPVGTVRLTLVLLYSSKINCLLATRTPDAMV
jgi:hypothetical protein